MSSSYWEILNMLSVFIWPPSWTDVSMSPLQSEAAKEFRQPRPSLPPPDRKGQPGKFSFIQFPSTSNIWSSKSQARAPPWWRPSATSRWSASTRPGRASSSSTSHLRSLLENSPSSSSWTTGYNVLWIVNTLSGWRSWRPRSGRPSITSSPTLRPSAPRSDWFCLSAMTLTVTQVVGVCTDSHVTVRAMLMNSASLKVVILIILTINDIIMSLKGIKFPIICDRDGDFSRAFGVLKLSGGNFGAARAVIWWLVFRILHSYFCSRWQCLTLRWDWSTWDFATSALVPGSSFYPNQQLGWDANVCTHSFPGLRASSSCCQGCRATSPLPRSPPPSSPTPPPSPPPGKMMSQPTRQRTWLERMQLKRTPRQPWRPLTRAWRSLPRTWSLSLQSTLFSIGQRVLGGQSTPPSDPSYPVPYLSIALIILPPNLPSEAEYCIWLSSSRLGWNKLVNFSYWQYYSFTFPFHTDP